MTLGASFGFDSAFLRRLEHVALVSRYATPGTSAGPRRSPRHGSSPEFADFRDYSPGDDLRRVDWNAYARLDRLFLRLYSAEEMATLSLYIDHSRSMSFGDESKLLMAGRLAAALAYVGLYSHDHVAVAGWSDSVDLYLPPQAGLQAVPRVWRFIERIMAAESGQTEFAALRRESRVRQRRGSAVVVSDFLTESDWRSGLLSLAAGNQEVTVLQVLSPEELDPTLRGDWELVDVETGSRVEVSISSRHLRHYRATLEGYLEEIRSFCHRQGMNYALIPSDERLEERFLGRLQGAGVLR
jgi:uncharacterized protein (DUF58 family)